MSPMLILLTILGVVGWCQSDTSCLQTAVLLERATELLQSPQPNPESCQLKCVATTSCLAFTFGYGKCSLKSSFGSPKTVDTNEIVSGFKFCVKEIAPFYYYGTKSYFLSNSAEWKQNTWMFCFKVGSSLIQIKDEEEMELIWFITLLHNQKAESDKRIDRFLIGASPNHATRWAADQTLIPQDFFCDNKIPGQDKIVFEVSKKCLIESSGTHYYMCKSEDICDSQVLVQKIDNGNLFGAQSDSPLKMTNFQDSLDVKICVI